MDTVDTVWTPGRGERSNWVSCVQICITVILPDRPDYNVTRPDTAVLTSLTAGWLFLGCSASCPMKTLQTGSCCFGTTWPRTPARANSKQDHAISKTSHEALIKPGDPAPPHPWSHFRCRIAGGLAHYPPTLATTTLLSDTFSIEVKSCLIWERKSLSECTFVLFSTINRKEEKKSAESLWHFTFSLTFK